MADNEVIVDIKADTSSADRSLKKLEGTAKDSGETIGANFGKAFKIGLGVAVAGIAAFGVVLSKGIKEAISQENAINELNNALARTGQYSNAASLDMQNFASEIQNTTIFTDDAITSNAALIQSLGKLSVSGLKQATTAATDLSAALGIDLRAASVLVGKAAAGEVGSFGRYGLVIKQGADNAETFANALRAINNQFGGAAAAQANTYGGRVEQMKNAFGDLLEEVGNLIIKSPGLVNALKFTGGAIDRIKEAIIAFRESGGFERLLTSAADVARFFTSILGPVFEGVYNAIVAVGNALGALASAIVELFAGNFRLAGEQAKAAFTESFTFEAFSQNGTDSALAYIDGFKQAVVNAPPVTTELKNKVQQEVDTFEGISWSGFINGFRMSVEQMRTTAQQLMAQLKQTVVTGVGGAFQAIGAALVKGENAFGAFGKAILGMFGDLAIQLGSFYLTLGLANLFLNPAAAASQLAGGAALLALGGALKALAGGGGGATAPSTSGGGSASAPVGQTTLASNLEGQEQGPRTEVNVNIAGNVLDRRETGLEIADIINETFSTNGLVIARGVIV